VRVLITGITGMVGSHLADYILENHPGVEIHGLVRWRSPKDHIRHIEHKIILHTGDLTDYTSLADMCEESDPDWIFHLAAHAFVPSSFKVPAETLRTNIIGTANLLDAVFNYCKEDVRIHVCSSSEIYGQVKQDEIPITEHQPFRPASPYAVSKIGEDMIAYQYGLSYGMDIIRTRMYTHTGPRRWEGYVVSSFAKQIAEIEKGLRSFVRVGNLSSIRTFADVRDTVRAYWMMMERCSAGEVYNIGGDRTMTIGEMLEILKSLAECEIKVAVDVALLRPSDVTLQIPDVSKFKRATGWEPKIPFEQTLQDTLDYWRGRLYG